MSKIRVKMCVIWNPSFDFVLVNHKAKSQFFCKTKKVAPGFSLCRKQDLEAEETAASKYKNPLIHGDTW